MIMQFLAGFLCGVGLMWMGYGVYLCVEDWLNTARYVAVVERTKD